MAGWLVYQSSCTREESSWLFFRLRWQSSSSCSHCEREKAFVVPSRLSVSHCCCSNIFLWTFIDWHERTNAPIKSSILSSITQRDIYLSRGGGEEAMKNLTSQSKTINKQSWRRKIDVRSQQLFPLFLVAMLCCVWCCFTLKIDTQKISHFHHPQESFSRSLARSPPSASRRDFLS